MTTATTTKPANKTTPKEEKPNITISERLTAGGALFNIAAEDRIENGPIMSGSIEVSKGLNIPVSAFKKLSENNLEYLSLSLGGEGKTHYYGKLFRKGADAKVNAPDYSGFISVLPCAGSGDEYSQDDWDNAPQLRIVANRERSLAGQAYIGMKITPKVVDANEVNF